MSKNVTEIIDKTPAKPPSRETVVTNNYNAERALTDAEASKHYGVHWWEATGGWWTGRSSSVPEKSATVVKSRENIKQVAQEKPTEPKQPVTEIKRNTMQAKGWWSEPILQKKDHEDAISPENRKRFGDLRNKQSKTQEEINEMAGYIQTNKAWKDTKDTKPTVTEKSWGDGKVWVSKNESPTTFNQTKTTTDKLDSATLDLVWRAWGSNTKDIKPEKSTPTETTPTAAEKTPAPAPVTESAPKDTTQPDPTKSLSTRKNNTEPKPPGEGVTKKIGLEDLKAKWYTLEWPFWSNPREDNWPIIETYSFEKNGKEYFFNSADGKIRDDNGKETTFETIEGKGDKTAKSWENNTTTPVKHPDEAPANTTPDEISSKIDNPTDTTPGKTRDDIIATNNILDTNISYKADIIPVTVGWVPQVYDRWLGNFWRDMTDSTTNQKVNTDTDGRLHLVDRVDALNKNRPWFDPSKWEWFFGDAELFATNAQRKINTTAFDNNQNNDIFNNADKKIGFGAVPTKLMHQTLWSLTMAKNNEGRYEVHDNTGQSMGEYLKYTDGKSFIKVTNEAFAQSVGVPVGHYVWENGEIHDREWNLAWVIYRGHARMASNLNN